MEFEKQQSEIIALCKKLLSSGSVKSIIAYRSSSVDGKAIPYIFSDASQADNVVWNEWCVPNLSKYLIGRDEKTAIVAKACDVRAIVSLIVEKQLKRENIHIIGISCSGMKDEYSNARSACAECVVNQPPMFDSHIENSTLLSNTDPCMSDSKDSNYNSSTDNMRFENELRKCILCFACRQACYGCYCTTCFIERGVPNWQPLNPDMGEKALFHTVRTMHLAGRCVECGACENACASGVNLRYVIKDLSQFIADTYDYKAGLDVNTVPVMLQHSTHDPEVGFLGGPADD